MRLKTLFLIFLFLLALEGLTHAQVIQSGGGGGGGVSTYNGRSGAVTSQPSDMTAGVNPQTGTSYTIAASDNGKLITFSNASAVAVTLPQATGSFGAGFFCEVENLGAGTVTITPSTSTIDAASSITITQNTGLRIFSDGTNYATQRGKGSPPGGTSGQFQTNNGGGGFSGVSATGSGSVVLQTSPALTTPSVTTGLNDQNGNAMMSYSPAASAVNNLQASNAAAGGSPALSATGSDTNISVTVNGKGTGALVLGGTTPLVFGSVVAMVPTSNQLRIRNVTGGLPGSTDENLVMGTLTANGGISTTSVTAGASSLIGWSGGTRLFSSANGVLQVNNSTQTEGVGGVLVGLNTTNNGAYLKRTQYATLEARSGDDTSVGTFVSNGAPLYEGKLSTTTGVNLNATGPVTLLTVPSGKNCIVTKIVLKNASTSLTTASYSFGFDANATNVVGNATHTELTGSTVYTKLIPANGSAIGSASSNLAIKVNTLQGAAATVDIDIFGYFY